MQFNPFRLDEGDLGIIVGSAVFISFMLENWVNHSVAEAEETDSGFLAALASPPPLGVFAGMAGVTLVFSAISAYLADNLTELVEKSKYYIAPKPEEV
tara:strand:- start:13886 stop:14179 length:294 start_codon:yes stop_codon:yes gene_type:complete